MGETEEPVGARRTRLLPNTVPEFWVFGLSCLLGLLFVVGFAQTTPLLPVLVALLSAYEFWNSHKHLRRGHSFQHRVQLLQGEVFAVSCFLGLILQPFVK